MTRRDRTRGFIDLPYGVTFTNAANVPLSQVSTVDPSTQPGLSGAILVDDNKQPQDAELELDAPAAHPLPDDRSRLPTSAARATVC